MNKKIVKEKMEKYDPSHVLRQVRALRMYWRSPRHRDKAEKLIEFAEAKALEEMNQKVMTHGN